jgi:NACHT domain
MDLVSLQLSEGFTALDQSTRDIARTLLEAQSIPEDVKDQMIAVAQLLNRIEKPVISEDGKTRDEIPSPIYQTGRLEGWPRDSVGEKERQTGPAGTIKTHIRTLVDEMVLESLRYPTMTVRMENMEEAHVRTFDWIFQECKSDQILWDSFFKWLTDNSGIYWINGKAGSGKSTLMRYIYANPKTRRLLSNWAAPLPPTSATFFFWNNGNKLQKDRVGFLRSILYEIFDQHRGLILNLLPALWARSYTSLIQSITQRKRETWSVTILSRLFRELVAQDKIPLKVCLFVDGLDEYDGGHGKIVELIQDISKLANVKVCISSRPLKIFEDTFRSAPKLCLEDLTSQDIRQYAMDRLVENARFKQLTLEEPIKAPEFVEEIVRKADGVFLLAVLVVKSLLADLGNRDDIPDLQRRLGLLPRKLGDMYAYILHKIDPSYQRKASEYFQLLRAVNLVDEIMSSAEEDPKMLTIFGLALADDADSDLASALNSPTWTDLAITQKCENMIDRLKVCCSGLLEVYSYNCSTCSMSLRPQYAVAESWRRVQYLHRTLREYLEQPESWKSQLQLTSSYGFNPHLQMLKSYMLQIKVLPVASDFLQQNMPVTLTHAHFADTGVAQPYVDLLDGLDRIVTQVWEQITHEEGILNYWMDDPMLLKAVQYGCGTYVKYKLNPRNNYAVKNQHLMLLFSGRPLLDIAIEPGLKSSKMTLSPQVIEALLQSGAKPNLKYENASPWERAIKVQFERYLSIPSDDHERGRECALQSVEVFRSFLRHGAKRDASCCVAGELVSVLVAVDKMSARLTPEETAEAKRQLGGADNDHFKRHSLMRVLLPRKKDK